VIGTDPPVTASPTRVIATEWTLRTFLELGALPTAVPCARLHTKQVLWEWQLSELADTAELIVSELTTNAVQASVGLTGSRRSGRWVPGVPPVRLWLFSDGQRVLVQVWDGNDKLPAPQHAEPDAETGRGLLLVESLSAEWGTYPPEWSGGKVVWAMLGEPPP
jgi:hypothetical protein